MKWICSNHIFEPILSNHVLQIHVDLIEKLILCSWQGGSFEARLARPNLHKNIFWNRIRMPLRGHGLPPVWLIFAKLMTFLFWLMATYHIFHFDNQLMWKRMGRDSLSCSYWIFWSSIIKLIHRHIEHCPCNPLCMRKVASSSFLFKQSIIRFHDSTDYSL